jgi:hypothetical protein
VRWVRSILRPIRPRLSIDILFTAAGVAPAFAGMPVPFARRGMAQVRLEAISFFLVVLLVSAMLVQWIWNGMRAGP